MSTSKWSISEMPDQTDKTVIVTGGNSGIGFETAKIFASKGAHVIIACRSLSRGMKARDKIAVSHPVGNISVLQLDLADPDSIRAFATRFQQTHSQLDVLINNAGIMGESYKETSLGIESHLAVNHLGHFALTGQLLPVLLATPNSRVVIVGSLAHYWGKGILGSFSNGKRKYKSMKAYGRSKLANLLFAYELQRRFEENNLNCMAVAVHPGASFTNLGRYFEEAWLLKWLRPLIIKVLPKPHNAARPQLMAATSPHVKGGDYYGPSKFLQLGGNPVKLKSSKKSYDPELAQQVWEKSEELTRVKFYFDA